VTPVPYELGMARPARRAISESLPEDVATGAVKFITGPLLEMPRRIGKPLQEELPGLSAADVLAQEERGPVKRLGGLVEYAGE
jgi:hypothetical protein